MKEMWVIRMLVDVLMDRVSPCWVISTAGLEAAVTAIFLRNTFTPVDGQTELVSYEVLVFGLGSFSTQILYCDFTLDNACYVVI